MHSTIRDRTNRKQWNEPNIETQMMHNTSTVSSPHSNHPPSFTQPNYRIYPPLESTTSNCSRRQCLIRSNAQRLRLIHWPRFDHFHVWHHLLVVMLLVGSHLVAANVVSASDDHRSNSTTNHTHNTTISTTTTATDTFPLPIGSLNGNQQLVGDSAAAASTQWMDSTNNQVVGAVQLKSVQQANQQQKPSSTSGGGDDDDYYFDKDDDLDEYELLIANKSGEFQSNPEPRLLVIDYILNKWEHFLINIIFRINNNWFVKYWPVFLHLNRLF